MKANKPQEIPSIYPWQHAQWARLQWARNQGKLGHAFLLTGLAGLGKLTFARSFAASLLCFSPDASGHACGHCRSCHLLQHSVHPDLQEVRPEEELGALKVEQIRVMTATLAETSHLGGKRVVIIEPAETLNLAASNALLKTLEEPGAGIVLLLVSACPAVLPATLRSRAQKIVFHPAQDDAATRQWLTERGVTHVDLRLQLARGAPLSALDMKEESLGKRQGLLSDLLALAHGATGPIELAEKYLKQDINELLVWLMAWLGDMARYKVGGQPVNNDIQTELIELSSHTSLHRVFFSFEKLLEMRRLAYAKANPNLQLMLEEVFTGWPLGEKKHGIN